jgi:type 1 fimbria pilin
VLAVELDGKAFSLILCGVMAIDGGYMAQFRTTRPNGFVHCIEVDCGNESVPLTHAVDAISIETIITRTHSGGEIPDDDQPEDCAELARTMKKQSLAFDAPLSDQNNLGAGEGRTLVLHELEDNTLEELEMDLLEVDGAAGAVKVGIALASGDIAEDGTLVAGDLAVTREEGGLLPGFSYGWLPDPDALIWETEGSGANEKNVNVQADSGYHAFVNRYTAIQQDGGVYIRIFKKADVQVLKNGEQAIIGSQVYSAELAAEDGQGIVEIELDAVE